MGEWAEGLQYKPDTIWNVKTIYTPQGDCSSHPSEVFLLIWQLI